MDTLMKGETMVINGDRWTVVDVAPAAPLAEMVAALLEDEGYVVMVRGLDLHSDAISHLGTTSVMTTYVLVPEGQAEAAIDLVAETVTDYEGPELDVLMEQMARGEVEVAGDELADELGDDPDDDLDDDLDDDSDEGLGDESDDQPGDDDDGPGPS